MTTKELHAVHWRYVCRLLPRYGILAEPDVDDVAQEVWLTVEKRLHTYDEQAHRSWRAWITGITRRCAANHRRAERGAGDLEAIPAELAPAPGLDAEETAILWGLIRSLRNGDQREALLLQALEGLSLTEIAAIQGVTPDAVQKRLRMAKKQLRGDGDEKAGAFLGFGSLEALIEALRPKHELPDEVGERQWERIAEAIRQQEGAPADDGPPSSSLPPPLPVLPQAPAGLVVIGKAKLAGLLVAVFLGGTGTGVGGMLAWEAWKTPREAAEMHAPPIAPLPVTGAAIAPSSTAPAVALSGAAPSAVAPSAAPASVALSSAARSAVAPATTAPSSVTSDETRSMLLLFQMDRAIEQRQFAHVLLLVEQHAQAFGSMHKPERDAARRQALKGLERAPEAQRGGAARPPTP